MKVLLCGTKSKGDCLKHFEQGTTIRWGVQRSLFGRMEDSFCGVRHKTVRDNGNLKEGHGSGNGEQELDPKNTQKVESPNLVTDCMQGVRKGVARVILWFLAETVGQRQGHSFRWEIWEEVGEFRFV